MISNYLYTIGKYLAPSQRDEVQKEIKANLYDYLEENFGEKEYTENEIEEAIRSLGHPQKVAEAYMNNTRSLIGNAYIDTYWLVVKLVVIGTAIGLTVSNIVSFTGGEDAIDFFIKLFASLWQSSFSLIGMVTVIFAAINYYNPQESIIEDENWSLSLLETAPEPNDKVSITELVVESFFICIVLVVLNNLFVNIENLGINIIPIANMTYFKAYIPWINLLLGGWLLTNIYLLIKRQWQKQIRVLRILLDITGIVLALRIAFDSNVFNLSSVTDRLGVEASSNQWPLLTSYIVLAVFIAVSSFELYQHLKALFMKRKV